MPKFRYIIYIKQILSLFNLFLKNTMAKRFNKEPFISKQAFKRRSRECRICGEDDYEVLECHRIEEGCNGGKYENTNCVCLCSSCHTRVTKGIIITLRWVHSTKGNLLFIIDENGEEKFI